MGGGGGGRGKYHIMQHGPAAPSTTRPTPNDVVKYIDAADANDVVIYFRHVFTHEYLISEDEGPHTVPILGEPYVCRWPDEWSLKVEALKKYQRDGGISFA